MCPVVFTKLELELELIASITEEQYKTSTTDYKSAKRKKSIGCKYITSQVQHAAGISSVGLTSGEEVLWVFFSTKSL